MSGVTTEKVFASEPSALLLAARGNGVCGVPQYLLVLFSILFDIADLLSQLLKVVFVIGVLLL